MVATNFVVQDVLIPLANSKRGRLLFRATNRRIYLADVPASVGESIAASQLAPVAQALNVAGGRYVEFVDQGSLSTGEPVAWAGLAVYNPTKKTLLIEEPIGVIPQTALDPVGQQPAPLYTPPRVKIGRYTGKTLLAREERYSLDFNGDGFIGDVVNLSLGAELYTTTSQGLWWSPAPLALGAKPDPTQARLLSSDPKLVASWVAAYDLLKTAGGSLVLRSLDRNNDGQVDGSQLAFPLYRAAAKGAPPQFAGVQLYDLGVLSNPATRVVLKPQLISKPADVLKQESLFEADLNGDQVVGDTYRSLRASKGAALVSGDWVFVRYQGHLVDAKGNSGDQFDANYDFSSFQDVPNRSLFSFQLGEPGVIEGWQRGLLGRRVGEVFELTIPPSLAYANVPSSGVLQTSTLRFTIEVVGALSPDQMTPLAPYNLTRATFADFGLQPAAIGLLNRDLLSKTANGGFVTAVETSMVGLDGDDVLTGLDRANENGTTFTNRDLILGLAGDDRITGGLGGDFLFGGPGRNTFVYKDINDSLPAPSARDRIYGFTAQDKIDLSAIEGAKVFSNSATHSGNPGEVIFRRDNQDGLLQWDRDGDGQPDFAILFPQTTTFLASQLVG